MYEQLISAIIGALSSGFIAYLIFWLSKKRDNELRMFELLTELLSECYIPLRYEVNRGVDALSEGGTKGLHYKKPTIEAINKIRIKYEYELNTELIDHLKLIIKADKKGKSRIDDIEIFKIERGHLDNKYKLETTRNFKARMLNLIDNEINLLKANRNELKKKLLITGR